MAKNTWFGYRDKGFGIDKSTKPQTICQIIKKYYQTSIGGIWGISHIKGMGVSSIYRRISRSVSHIETGGYKARVYKEYLHIPIGIYKPYKRYTHIGAYMV